MFFFLSSSEKRVNKSRVLLQLINLYRFCKREEEKNKNERNSDFLSASAIVLSFCGVKEKLLLKHISICSDFFFYFAIAIHFKFVFFSSFVSSHLWPRCNSPTSICVRKLYVQHDRCLTTKRNEWPQLQMKKNGKHERKNSKPNGMLT